MSDQVEDLERLAEMLDSGKITEEEYGKLKAEVLNGPIPYPATTAPPPLVGVTPDIDNQTRWWLIGAGVLMAIGSLLPWVQAGIFSAAGTDGDGVFTLIGGVIVAIIGIANKATAITGIGTVVVSAFSIWVTWTVISGTLDLTIGSAGTGVYLTLLASLFALIAGFKVFNRRAR